MRRKKSSGAVFCERILRMLSLRRLALSLSMRRLS
jgi:hypothetical protein